MAAVTDGDENAFTPLDLRGLTCPRLVLRLAEVLRKAAPGALFRVLTTDPPSVIDVPFYLERHGHTLQARLRHPEGPVFLVACHSSQTSD